MSLRCGVRTYDRDAFRGSRLEIYRTAMSDKAGRDFDKKARNIVCGLAVGFIAAAFLLYRFDPGFADGCISLFSIGIALFSFALLLSFTSEGRG